MPKVSIVLPIYNGEKYIKEALESIFSQTFSDWELIIVNDCSTDNSLKVIDDYVKGDRRVKIITNSVNQKLPRSLNIGFRESCGDYLTWTSDDNIMLENALEKMVDFLDTNAEYSMICADYECINPAGKVLNKVTFFDELKLFYCNCVGACFLYRREVLETIGEYNPALFLIEDYDYWFRIIQSGRKIARISEVLYKYRMHEMSLTSLQFDRVQERVKEYQLSNLKEIVKNLKAHESYLVDFYYELCGKTGIEEIDSVFAGKSEVIDADRNWDEHKPCIIYGAGNFGKKAHDLLRDKVHYFADRDEKKIGTLIDGVEVISPQEMIAKKDQYNICLAMSRESVYQAYYYLKSIGLEGYMTLYNLERWNEKQDKVIVFFGAGKIGKGIMSFYSRYNVFIDYFCDNSPLLWGTEIEGIPVISPKELRGLSNVQIYITTAYKEAIIEQLKGLGFSDDQYIVVEHLVVPELSKKISWKQYLDINKGILNEESILMDFSHGLGLGGVETWGCKTLHELNKLGKTCSCIYPEEAFAQEKYIELNIPHLTVHRKDFYDEKYIWDCIKTINESGCSYIICNFPEEIALAAFIVKKYINPQLKVIVVMHSDNNLYYKTYCLWQECIDVCLVISKVMYKKFIDMGFPKEKLRFLYWNIACEKELLRSYSSDRMPIRLGFVGRISNSDKRVNSIIDVAEILKLDGVDFQLEIAGVGHDYDLIKSDIVKRSLQENVKLLGYVENDNINDFWLKQDICISCSCVEGHSISQSEAMANGTVMVITNTSGSEDDVICGENGYIIYDFTPNAMAEKIKYLYHNRSLLPRMGKKSHDIIIERNKKMRPDEYWADIINI